MVIGIWGIFKMEFWIHSLEEIYIIFPSLNLIDFQN